MSDGVGATSGVTPLAFLAANDRELLLSGNRGTFRIPQLSVKRISRGRFYPWLFRSVQIHHDLPSLPRELQFKPMQSNAPAVLARLKQLGYPVA